MLERSGVPVGEGNMRRDESEGEIETEEERIERRRVSKTLIANKKATRRPSLPHGARV